MARREGFYSRWVAVLKLCLPLLAILILTLIFVVEREDDFEGGGLSFSQAEIEELGSGLKLTNPQLSGTTDTGERYVLNASSVAPVNVSPDRLAAERLSGTLTDETREIRFEAARAEIIVSRKYVTLTDGARAETSDGYLFATPNLVADLEAATLQAQGPVEAEGPIGRIEAGSLEISPDPDTRKRVIWFRNGVTVRYTPEGLE